uniref:Acylphosphatase 2 n=1 Tax=Pygocentrus nattereri TaxID=42514 RepID=A0AAR2K6T5_PYGNA
MSIFVLWSWRRLVPITTDLSVCLSVCLSRPSQYTEREGLTLGLVGWVKNTNRGTVVGQVQGPRQQVHEMKVWLSKEGSPSSRITRAVFKNERDISKLELSGFSTRF